MKHLTIAGLAATVAMALIALVGAGSASAAGGTLCSTATNPCNSRWASGTVVDFSLKAGTKLTWLTTEGLTLNSCSGWTLKGKLLSNPGGATQATSSNTSIQWTECNATTDTSKLGALRFEAEDDTGNGFVYADEEIKETQNLSIFGDCEYGFTPGTLLGTIKEGGEVSFNAVAKRLNSCVGPETERWRATLVLTEPTSTTLYVSTS